MAQAEPEDDQGRRTELDQELEWVEAYGRRDVQEQVRVMNAVNAPQHGHLVHGHVDHVRGEAPREERHRQGGCQGQRRAVEESPALLLGEYGHRQAAHRQRSQHDDVERRQPEVRRPSPGALGRTIASGPEGFHGAEPGQKPEVDEVLQRLSVVRQDAFERHEHVLSPGRAWSRRPRPGGLRESLPVGSATGTFVEPYGRTPALLRAGRLRPDAAGARATTGGRRRNFVGARA
jgi:hypothetical protein